MYPFNLLFIQQTQKQQFSVKIHMKFLSANLYICTLQK